MPGGVLALRGSGPDGTWEIHPFGRLGETRQTKAVTAEAAYDLASVTKIFCTTNLCILARDRGLIADLDAPLSAYGWQGPADTVSLSLRNLLGHRSGLPAWRPLYLSGGEGRSARIAIAKAAILRERPLFVQGTATLYSDLGFILLGILMEELFGAPLDDVFRREIAVPLALEAAGFSPLAEGGFAVSGPAKGTPVAPTEDGFRCGGPLDLPGVPILGPVPTGRVHDDNASWLGGASGHAGLFAAIRDAARILDAWLAACHGRAAPVSGAGVREFMSLQGHEGERVRRGLGFDAIERPGGKGPLFGHRGYTGAAAWLDPEGSRAMALLTNRVHPTARRGGMDGFRAALMKSVFKG
ncbi:MAG: beta-lactamase family protein [Deltaproteobacteria bacterium]|jgi:CubicO group peptidase (beta-lactamase class C family)|nr:beta-lactamase family protein [Deltaproteobacteria bacterium]